MSIAQQLNKQFNQPKPRRQLGLDSSGLTVLSTSNSVRSFSMGTASAPKPAAPRVDRDCKSEDAKENGREEPETPTDTTAGAKSSTFESDRCLAAMWLKKRCGVSSVTPSLDSKVGVGSAPGSMSSQSLVATKSPAKFAAKNSIVRQCAKCHILFTAAHACQGESK